MDKEVKIKDILSFLKREDISYTFEGDENQTITGFSSLFNYKKNSMTFISTLYSFIDYKEQFLDKKIRLIIMDPSEDNYDNFENIIIISKPTNAFFTILEEFFSREELSKKSPVSKNENEYKQFSYVSDNAKIGSNVSIGRGCVIEAGVAIGDNTAIHHNVVIRSGTKIGQDCIIRSGTVIGEDGFNPSTRPDGSKQLLKHYGGVIINDNVHIGPKCNIHKGSIDDTVIETGVKVNANVHIAHNCFIGENTVITMPTQVNGSVRIGSNCHIAATTIRNQCTVGNNVVLGLGSVVIKDVSDNLTMIGNPARELER